MKNFTSAKKTRFEKINIFINQCGLCDIFDITRLIFKREEPVIVMKNGKELRLRKDVTKDSTDNMTVVIF